MKLSLAFLSISTASSFVIPKCSFLVKSPIKSHITELKGYLDDLTEDIKPTDESKKANPERDSHEYNKLKPEDIDRFGPGTLGNFVDFDEFDGGDGQMGVAGDGNSQLEDIGEDTSQRMVKKTDQNVVRPDEFKVKTTSRERSARNAWGSGDSSYSDALREKGVDTQKAQRLENWQKQQEVLRERKKARYETDEFDAIDEAPAEEDWRLLSKFGVERNQDFDLEEAFGPVTPDLDNTEETIEMHTNVNSVAFTTLNLKNLYMGFADFRAALSSDTSLEWSIEPEEGSLNKSDETEFILRFKPSTPGVSEGYLVIETEDWKKTWKVIGNTA
ncbi:hypothetical protein TrST_g4755 [Triparma strigata]|uniref:Uncharacterized protein n=1 Tax=Triparma strigata TaxID=1606541 RepID=A0A9W7EH10_9STRA|nr:hypothetical protein TrST_g4755 [Triparma strigata]